jgi:hypothetical protein
MIKIGIAPRFQDFKNEAFNILDSWFNQVTARFNINNTATAVALGDVPNNQWGIFKDTSTGDVSLVVNDDGTLKEVDIPTTSISPATSLPLMDGVAAIGVTTSEYALPDHVHPTDTSRAPVASPVFTGNPTAPTPAVDDSDTSIITSAWYTGQKGTTNPLINGTAAPGTSARWSPIDHIHPTDTSRAALASPTFTGTPAAPTAAVDTNTTQLATTAFVVGQASSSLPLINGTATVGTSLRYSRGDHIHPTDTSRMTATGPVFSAYRYAAQAIPNATWTKIQINTVEFDPASCVDIVNNRIVPNLAGYYQINGQVMIQGAGVGSGFISLWKNGAVLKYGSSNPNNAAEGTWLEVNAIISFNGSTDYLEVYVYQNSGGAMGLRQVVAGGENRLDGGLLRPL